MSHRVVVTDSQGREIPPDVAQALNKAHFGIKSEHAAAHVWRRLLAEEDRQLLGGDFLECFRRLGTAGLWQELKGVSFDRAVVEVAQALGNLDEATAHWLLRELHEESSAPQTPDWDAQRGELLLSDQVIRTIRVMQNPSNIQQILDAFEDAGWPAAIPNPLTGGQQQLHEALRSLSNGLTRIRFSSQQGGQTIYWKRG